MAGEYKVKVRPEKVETVDRIKGEIGETQAAVLTEYRGLTVTELATLRAQLREQETSYQVVKNTLARRAASDLGLEGLDELFAGPVAVAYVKGDPVAAARVLATFARDHPQLVIKGGVLEGRVLSADEAKGLATIDPLDVSRAKIAGLLTAPLRRLMMLLEAPAGRILFVLEELGRRAPEGAEAPAAEDETASPETGGGAADTEPPTGAPDAVASDEESKTEEQGE